MTKKASRSSIKDLILNQATSTVEDLYAKRNALLASEEREEGGNISPSNQINLTSQMNYTNSMVDINPLVEKIPLQSDPINFTGQNNLTINAVEHTSLVKDIAPSFDQTKLTSKKNLIDKMARILQSTGLLSVAFPKNS
jgi:hypothetical protein